MNTYSMKEADVSPRLLAGVRAVVPAGKVPELFRTYLDQVYAAGRGGAIQLDGQNVFVYHPRADGDLTVDFCVGVKATFSSIGAVVPVETPSGVAATTTHWGSYAGLRSAHDALQAWCRTNDRATAGPSWEVYGHWSDDPAKVRTDIYYLLR